MTKTSANAVKPNKAMQIKIIDKACANLSYELVERSRGDFDKFVQMLAKEEREYRSAPSRQNYHFGLTVAQATKLAAVNLVARYLDPTTERIPQAIDFFRLRTVHFMAASLANEYAPYVRKAFEDFDLELLKVLDYAELNA